MCNIMIALGLCCNDCLYSVEALLSIETTYYGSGALGMCIFDFDGLQLHNISFSDDMHFDTDESLASKFVAFNRDQLL